jgi:hypothetical protein
VHRINWKADMSEKGSLGFFFSEFSLDVFSSD